MKKLVSLLLAVCMCLSVSVMLTACGQAKTSGVPHVVLAPTQSEWTAAFNATVNAENLTFSREQLVNKSSDGVQTVHKDNEKIFMEYSHPYNTVQDCYFYKADNTIYHYTNSTGNAWECEETNDIIHNLALSDTMMPFEALYSSFAFDTQTEMFILEEAEVLGFEMVNIEIKIENGHITYFTYTMVMDSSADIDSNYTMIFYFSEYGTTAVTLPTVVEDIIDYTVTEDEWKINFNLTRGQTQAQLPSGNSTRTLTEITSYTVYAVGENVGTPGTSLLKVSPDAMFIEFYVDGTFNETVSGIFESDTDFYKNLTANVMSYFPFANYYNDFAFDQTKNAYVCQNLTSTTDEYDDSKINYVYTKTAEVTFVNGYLNTITIELCDETFEDIFASFVFTFSDINNTIVEA